MSNKLTIRQRAKALVSRITNTARRAVARVKHVAKVVAFKTAVIARASWAKTATAWRQSIRPILKVVGAIAVATAWTSAILVAPLGTVGITTAAGLVLIALGSLLERLDASTSMVARIVVRAIEVFAQALRAAFYLLSAAFIVATLPAWAPVFAAYAVAEFLLRTLPEPANGVPAPSIIDAEWETPAATRRPSIVVVEAEVASPAPTMHRAIRAMGTEEMREFPGCAACGDIEASLVRSMDDHHFADGSIRPSDAWLCGECFDRECEDNAIKYTGVSLKKVSVDVRLNEAGLLATSECQASIKDLDHVFWTAQPTAWWRDKNGQLHARAWSCFNGGNVVATVSFEYRRGVYRAATLGKVVGGPQKTLQLAQRLANDTLFDESTAVTRLMQDLDSNTEHLVTGKVG